MTGPQKERTVALLREPESLTKPSNSRQVRRASLSPMMPVPMRA